MTTEWLTSESLRPGGMVVRQQAIRRRAGAV